MKSFLLVILFTVSDVLSATRPDCAKPCYEKDRLELPCDPNEKTCFCDVEDNDVAKKVTACIAARCGGEIGSAPQGAEGVVEDCESVYYLGGIDDD
ncbi:hypothetical protein K523DRAFT_350858 [Schizophyllum commune Tattone D]|nr:hypothetical protein K523DRAFT_350858 [Schizophyllum commune Tattone D]